MPDTAPPIIPGYTLTAGPFASVWGTQGYLLYEGGPGAEQPLTPAGYDPYSFAPNKAGNALLIIRPVKVAAVTPTPVPVPPPPAPPVVPTPPPVPAPVPPPPPVVVPPAPPVLPVIVRRVADPNAAVRGEPFGIIGPTANELRDIHVEGYRQNLTYMTGGGSLTLNNVRSVKAYREASKERYQGQGLYFGNPTDPANPPPQNQWPGPATIRGCLFGWNGYRQNDGNKNGYRHGIYGGRFAGLLDIADSIFVGNACAGVQLRRGGTIRHCVFVDNGIGILAVAGDVTLEDCVILGGHRYAEVDGNGQIASWTGNNAVSNYTHLTLRNCLFAGVPGQAAPTHATPPEFDMGCVMNSASYKDHPDWPPPGGGVIDASGCIIAGWPGVPFSGDKQHSGAGFTVKANPVSYDPAQVLNDVLANKVSIPDACATIAAAVRAGAK